MKTVLAAPLALIAASPALAHADPTFHTHGTEVSLILAALTVAAAIAIRSRK